MVVAPKGLSYAFSPWEALDRARGSDVYIGLLPKGLLSSGGEGVKADSFWGNLAYK